jgi:hypothetical protein
MEDSRLDRELDAALANYAAAEPRTGLEGRILATLKAEREFPPLSGWQRWISAAVPAAIVVVMAWSIFLRSPQQPQDIAIRVPPLAAPQDTRIKTQAMNMAPSLRRPSVRTLRRGPVTLAAPSPPRLEQFPSPQPLSAQEKILESYVANYPEQAALVAQLRAEELLRDAAQERDLSTAASEGNSQQ